MTVDQVVSAIMRDKIFFENSGGGVTLSGGEPTFQTDFAEAVLRACKRRGIHTSLDTSGHIPYDRLHRLLEWTDLVLYDIKHMDLEEHRKRAGVSNELILANAAEVAQRVETWLRVPVIPGYNALDEFFLWLGEFGQRIGARKVCLLPYHEWGRSKFEQLGLSFFNTFKTPSSGDLQHFGSLCEAFGLEVTYGR
jgi:pyruvate formate lyase activating enzyme